MKWLWRLLPATEHIYYLWIMVACNAWWRSCLRERARWHRFLQPPLDQSNLLAHCGKNIFKQIAHIHQHQTASTEPMFRCPSDSLMKCRQNVDQMENKLKDKIQTKIHCQTNFYSCCLTLHRWSKCYCLVAGQISLLVSDIKESIWLREHALVQRSGETEIQKKWKRRKERTKQSRDEGGIGCKKLDRKLWECVDR